MDNITKKNEEIWDKLVQAGVPCSVPELDLTSEQAEINLNKDKVFGDLKGKKVLCLASGGGQQSLGFSLLGAEVTVVDFSNEQLKSDQLVADKFNLPIRIIKSDMRDLAQFKDAEFDVIYQPYSINYIPEITGFIKDISRIIKPDGYYHLMFHNPFVHGSWKHGNWGGEWKQEELWNDKGYPIWQAYKEGQSIETFEPSWDFYQKDGQQVQVSSPQEFKHTLSTIFNNLIQNNLEVIKFDEYSVESNGDKPGSWEHYVSVTAPWLFLWCKKK
jgi:ubiquinone/menaquinone biosynthesis C-methylase UbiE